MQPGNELDGQESRSFIETARRSQIVEAAIETIVEVGYAKASFARIAARAGISAGLISYHFASKSELIEQIVRDVNDATERAVEGHTRGAETHLAALRALIEGFVHYCAQHPSQLIAVGQIEDSEGWGAGEHEKSVCEFEQMLREGQDQGEFRDFSPRLMAVTLLAALEATPTELSARPDTDVDTYADELAVTFELAVQRPNRGNGSAHVG